VVNLAAYGGPSSELGRPRSARDKLDRVGIRFPKLLGNYASAISMRAEQVWRMERASRASLKCTRLSVSRQRRRQRRSLVSFKFSGDSTRVRRSLPRSRSSQSKLRKYPTTSSPSPIVSARVNDAVVAASA